MPTRTRQQRTIPGRRSLWFLLATLVPLLTPLAPAAEYFVAPGGDDAAAGVSWEAAFRTLARGVAVLQPGDTLTVGPGIYREEVAIPSNGTRARPIVLRAAIPHRAELVGSLRLTSWSPVAGRRQVFRAPCSPPPRLVFEKDTATEYTECANADMVEDTPGTWWYDAKAAGLHVHPSDDRGMDHHVVDACVLRDGLLAETAGKHSPRRTGIVIEGFTVRDYSRYGIFIHNADDCVVRDCIVHHCRRGIFFFSALRSRIAGCESFACADRHNREQGNIGMMGYMFNCLLEGNVVHDSRQHGLRFYGASYGNTMRSNLAYRCDVGLHYKGEDLTDDFDRVLYLARYSDGGRPDLPPGLTNIFERNVCHQVGGSTGLIPNFCDYRYNTGEMNQHGRARRREANLDLETGDLERARFADPAWHDLRPQSDAPHRGKGPGGTDPGAHPYRGDVFYVAPGGDDGRTGTCAAEAWGTLAHAASRLRAGQTLYLLPGVYTEPLRLDGLRASAAEPTRIRAHGRHGAVLDAKGGPAGVVLAACTNLLVQGLAVRGAAEAAVRLDGCSALRLEACEWYDNVGDGVAAKDVSDLTLIGNTVVFNGGAAVRFAGPAAGLRILGNILRNNARPILFDGAEPAGTWIDFNNADAPLPPSAGPGNMDLPPGFVGGGGAVGARDLRLVRDSLCRGRGYLGAPVGAGRIEPVRDDALAFEDIRAAGVNATSADLAWSVRGGKATRLVVYGTHPDQLTNVWLRDEGPWYARHHGTTLTGLQPATRYFYRVGSRRLTEGPVPYHAFRYLWPERTPAGEAEYYAGLAKRDVLDDRIYDFTTRAADTAGNREIHVAPRGRADGAGTAADPWPTLRQAARAAGPGDRVVVHAGVYRELLVPLRSGLPGAPIVFEAARGEHVVIDGTRECIPFGANLVDRNHIVVRGFVFFGQAECGTEDSGFGHVQAVGCSDILIEHCLFDGRMNYCNPIHVGWSAEVVVRNNQFVSHHADLMIHDCTGPVTVERNTFLGPTLGRIYAPRNRRVVLRGNLFGEHLFPKKKRQYKVKLPLVEQVEMDYNCYVFDPANDERRLVDYLAPTSAIDNIADLPENDTLAGRVGIRGDLRVWQERYGQDRHSIVADPRWANTNAVNAARYRAYGWPDRDFEFEPLAREDFGLAADSPCLGAGADGGNIGADWIW